MGQFGPMTASAAPETSPRRPIRATALAVGIASIALLAVEARAHGIVERRARYRFPGTRNDWANGMLGVAPWNHEGADALVSAVETALIAELRGVTTERVEASSSAAAGLAFPLIDS